MATFTMTIDDQGQLDGLAWAREEYNKTAATPIDTDQEYLQAVVDETTRSYAMQKAAQPPPPPPESGA